MVRWLITVATAFAVLAHALLGCCAHHAHASTTSAGAEPAAAHHDCHTAHCHPEPSQPQRGDGRDHGSPCSEQECVFLAVAKANVICGLDFAHCQPLPGDTATLMLLLADDPGHEETPAGLSLPDPLRAQTQVWLL